MEEMKGSCSVLIIAHRLSTIKDANTIVVLHEGEVVESGTHDELLQKDGRYAQMIARQLQTGKDGMEDGDASPEAMAKDVEAQMKKLLATLPDEKRMEVCMNLFKGVKGKGKGK